MSTYFTSDLHLGHNRDFIFKNRGFWDITEHDKALISNINSVVTPEDELWILGDICFGDTTNRETADYYKNLIKLDCKNVKVILGNHDSKTKSDFYKEFGWSIEGYSVPFHIGHQAYLLSHYPTLTQNGRYKGVLNLEVINLYGHTHQQDSFLSVNGEIQPLSFHIGVDSNDLRPVELSEIRRLVCEKYEEVLKENSENIER